MMEPIATASHCHFLWGAELEYLNRESLFSSEIKMWWYFGELWYWWELRMHFLGESRVVIVKRPSCSAGAHSYPLLQMLK